MSRFLSVLPRQLFRSKTNTSALGSLVPRRFKSDTTKSSIPPYLLNIPPTKTTALSNGIIVATEEQPNETATVGVWVNTGSGYENDSNNGVAHFLEHLAFKGTGKREQKALELEIENIGASLNAYTSREQTVYYAKSFKEHVPTTLDILADIVQNSTLSEANIERERNTILKEAEEIENNTEEVIFDHLHAAAFQGTPLARPILGPEENIRKLTRKDLQDYIKTHYTGPRMVIAGAGGIKHEELVRLAEKSFAGIPNTDNLKDFNINYEYTGSEVRIRNDDLPLAHVLLGVEGLSWTDPDYFVLMLIQTIFGSWDRTAGGGANLSSRLCEAIATDNLAHSMQSFNTSYGMTGLVGNYAVAPPDKLDDLTGEIIEEWQRVATGVTANEVERAKSKLKASLMLSLDGNTQICEDIGRQILAIGRRLSPAEVFLRVNDITVSDVRRVATRIFTDVSPTLIGIGPIDDLPDYNVIRGWTYWNRL